MCWTAACHSFLLHRTRTIDGWTDCRRVDSWHLANGRFMWRREETSERDTQITALVLLTITTYGQIVIQSIGQKIEMRYWLSALPLCVCGWHWPTGRVVGRHHAVRDQLHRKMTDNWIFDVQQFNYLHHARTYLLYANCVQISVALFHVKREIRERTKVERSEW